MLSHKEEQWEKGGRGGRTYGVTKRGAELLDDDGEAAGDAREHAVAEGEVGVVGDGSLRLHGGELEQEQRRNLVRVAHYRPQQPHRAWPCTPLTQTMAGEA